jgi:hypothetical protein
VADHDPVEAAVRAAYQRHRDDPLPDVVAMVPAPRDRRRSPRILPTVTAAVLIGAVVTVAVLLSRGHQPGRQTVAIAPPTASTSPTPTPSHSVPPADPFPGTTGHREQIASALVSADGRHIIVPATGGGCIQGAALGATEGPAEVALHLTQYVSHAGGCPLNLIFENRSVTLASPLGGRRLVDGDTGRNVRYIDGRDLATVTWLPSGSSGPHNVLLDGWTRNYAYVSRRTAPISISQSAGNRLGALEYQANPDVELTTLTIHGHRARLITQKDHGVLVQDRLAWFEAGYTITVESQPDRTPQQPWAPRVIEHVARGLHFPNGG